MNVYERFKKIDALDKNKKRELLAKNSTANNDMWDRSILRIPEEKIFEINEILSQISEEEEHDRRLNCLEMYKFYRENYRNKW